MCHVYAARWESQVNDIFKDLANIVEEQVRQLPRAISAPLRLQPSPLVSRRVRSWTRWNTT